MTLLRPPLYLNEQLEHYNRKLQGSPGGMDFSLEGNSYD